MISLSETALGILDGYSYTIHSRLQSWFDGECVAEDIPAVEVADETDSTLRVPERLTFKVPIEVDGVSWVPTTYDAPLGIWGQKIIPQIGIGLGGTIEWITRGQYLITAAETSGSDVSVEALGLLQLVDEAVLPTEYQPKASATFQSIIRAMVEPGITALFSGTPTNRTVPSGITWSDNRLDNLHEALDAWPARGVMSQDGYFRVTAALEDPASGDEVFTFTDGEGGTVVEFSTSISRDGTFNAVVAKGQYPDTHATKAGQEIVDVAYDLDSTSPFRRGGPFSPFVVPYGYSSPLLTTGAEVAKAARTRMNTLRREASRTLQVTAVPHPGLQEGDPVKVISSRLGFTNELGRIGSIQLPHQADGGAMTIAVRLVD